MRVELRPADKLGERDGEVVTSVLSSILHSSKAHALDLAHLRVVGEWIQYRKNFRDAVAVREIFTGQATSSIEIAVDLRRSALPDADLPSFVESALARHSAGTDDRLYFEDWSPTRASCIWGFNALYWKALGLWETVSGKGYEQSLPGGESDARNAAAARETILELFDIWDGLVARKALPEQLHVLELGVGNGNQARVWLDEFVRIDKELGRDYYRRLHYLMGDYSPLLLDIAAANLRDHAEHVSGIVLDAMNPTKTLGFLKFKAFFVYISNVYDNLPSDELARVNGHNYAVETRAFVAHEEAARIAGAIGAPPAELPDLVRRLLRLGPELLAETAPRYFADALAVVGFWREVWEALRLEERYVPLQPLDTYEIAPGLSGDLVRSSLEANGDVRMHASNGAAASFADTLRLLHPHGMLQCHDLMVTDPEGYAASFRGPGKYEGSVVNWVNGPLLLAIGGRNGFDVRFRPFAHRAGSNITTLTARVRE